MMVLRRRRHQKRWLVPAVPMAGALTLAAALLLLILACHTLLASPVFEVDGTDHHNLLLQKPPLHRRRYKSSAILIKNPMELQQRNVVDAANVFRVPSDGGSPAKDLWASQLSKNFHGCSSPSIEFATEDTTLPDRYLMIATSGGLNQQRTGITDAVVAARILNATLVVPKLDEKSFWKDASDFSEIFDVDWFIFSLANDVKIIKNLPKKNRNIAGTPYNMRVPRRCNPRCYESRVLPALQKKHVVQLTKFDYRLANNLEADYQKLRCRVNYHALRFTDQIQAMGDMLIQRMKAKGSNFIALHLRFEPDMLAFSGCYYGGGSPAKDLWASQLSKNFHGCSSPSIEFATAEDTTLPDRYLMIATSGGLNQQRTGITDAVVAARILNATLVVPKLDEKSFWKDASDFSEIFDVDWFIFSLANDVKIIKNLPKKNRNIAGTPYNMRVPRRCNPRCYESRVLPALQKKHVVQLTKFDYRLANNLEADYQKLRCRVNYHALRFTDQIQAMGDMLIQRMKAKGSNFIALHLRFEPDMLAFSGCYYGGGEKERKELSAIRKRWKTLKTSNPEKARQHGKCPLTPEEVGLMLRALGFGDDVHIYVASGEVYGGEETLAPLKALFPNFHSKETLATKEELAPFSSFSSRMAALDFIVCDGSDVFVTNNNGNMARMLAGRRRYFGHKRTIRPNAKKLYSLLLNRTNMTWEAFSSNVHTVQKGFMGEPNEVKPGRGEFHENPETCICENTKTTAELNSDIWNDLKDGNGKTVIDSAELREYHFTDENLNWTELDYGENTPLDRALSNETKSEDYIFTRPDDPELEEIISD